MQTSLCKSSNNTARDDYQEPAASHYRAWTKTYMLPSFFSLVCHRYTGTDVSDNQVLSSRLMQKHHSFLSVGKYCYMTKHIISTNWERQESIFIKLTRWRKKKSERYNLVFSQKCNPCWELVCVDSEIEFSEMNLYLGQKLSGCKK